MFSSTHGFWSLSWVLASVALLGLLVALALVALLVPLAEFGVWVIIRYTREF